jgi:CheY-like chemotaxis protein
MIVSGLRIVATEPEQRLYRNCCRFKIAHSAASNYDAWLQLGLEGIIRLMSEIPSRILCVDDEEPILFTRRHILERAGYLVFTAKTGKEGMAIFREQPIDMVILDYWMAGMNGLDVATEMRRINQKTPIIMSSGYAPIPDERLGRVDLWLRKGEGDVTQLLTAVTKLLNRDGNPSDA